MLKIVFFLANSADPDEMPPYAAFHRSLHCLPKYMYLFFSYDIASGSEIMPCIKIDKLLVVYRFSGNVMKERF